MKQITCIEQIDSDLPEGRALLSALAIITTELHTDRTPHQVLEKINKLTAKIYSKPKINDWRNHPTLGPTGHGDVCMSDADPGL